MANKQDHADKDPDICQPLPAKNSANTLDGQVSNKDLWDRTHQAQIEIGILKRRWGWLGHTLRKPCTNITREVLTWNPQGKRKRGRPKNTWRRNPEADIKQTGNGCQQLERIAQDRRRWRNVVDGLCSRRS